MKTFNIISVFCNQPSFVYFNRKSQSQSGDPHPHKLKMKPLGVQEREARVLEVVKVVEVEVRVVVFQYKATLPRLSCPRDEARSVTNEGLISSSLRVASSRDLRFLLPAGHTTGVVLDTKQTVVVERVVVVEVVEM